MTTFTIIGLSAKTAPLEFLGTMVLSAASDPVDAILSLGVLVFVGAVLLVATCCSE